MKIDKFLKQLLFPQKCKCCYKMADEDNLCNECAEKLAKCKIDKDKLPIDLKLQLIDKIYCSYYYENEAKRAILIAKFKNPASFLNSFIADVGDEIKGIIEENEIDLILSSPFYKDKLYKSEFDLPFEMAKRISAFTGIVHNQCVKKNRHTGEQHHLNKSERKANLVNAFEVTDDVRDKNILLIDDVLTTGVTSSTIATELKIAGCKNVVVWTYIYNTRKE